MPGLRRTASVIAMFAALALMAFAPAAFAKTYRPTRTDDPNPNGCKKHNCSLREATIAANAHSGKDTIILKAGKKYKLSRAVVGDNETDGDLDLYDTHGVTVKSSSHKLATVDARHVDRVFDIGSGASFKYLLIRGGTSPDFGGGIYGGSGKLKVYRSVIRSNRALYGGGIEVGFGGASVSKSTVTGNHALQGGGLYNLFYYLSVSNSRIGENLSDGAGGGGIMNFGGVLKMVNDTVNNNAAKQNGGGIQNEGGGSANLNAITVARNLADSDNNGSGQGGGIYTTSGNPFNIQNTLIALNSANGNLGRDVYAGIPFASGGHNLIQHTDGLVTGFGGSDYLDGNSSPLHLGFLASNGGPTKTMALKKHSKAIGRANSHAPKRDQRGHKRHNPDIGAFER